MILTILLIVLVVCLLGGVVGWGGYAPAGAPYWGWSPLGLILIILLILWLFGGLH